MSTVTQSSPQANAATTPIMGSPAGAPLPTGHGAHDAQRRNAGGDQLATDQTWNDAHCPDVRGTHSPTDHQANVTHVTDVGGGETSPQAKVDTTTNALTPAGSTTDDGGHPNDDTHVGTAPVVASPGSPARSDTESKCESLASPTLALAADVLDDLETVRIANENRLRQLTRTDEDADGEERGFGLDATHPDVAKLTALVTALADAEHQGVLNLNRVLRRHPLGPWVKAQKGVGEKTAARLLAVIGDPYINPQTGQPRTVSQLWAYCGHGDPARVKFRGMTQDDLFRLGNPVAKKRTWLIATAILKAGGGEEKATCRTETIVDAPSLALAYYHRKQATVGREHATACKRCGPSGKPAQPGSPWSDAHRHADALRIVGKEFLRQLWIESKRIHEEQA